MAANQLWRWRGLTLQAEERQGTLWAQNRLQAMLSLQQQGVTALSLRRCPVRPAYWRTAWRCEIIEQLATLLHAGLTLSDGLEMLAQQHPIPQWQALLSTLSKRLAEGSTLSEALRQWPEAFPPLWLAMIHTGEVTGKLELCCQSLAQQQKAQQAITQKVKKALRYPCIILSLAVAVVVAMLGFVLPEFTAIYRTFNTPLPLLTQIVMRLADGVKEHFGLIAVTIMLPFLPGLLLKKEPRWQRFHLRIVLALPVMGRLVRGQMLSHIYTVLALTQSAGITFLQGLETLEDTLTHPHWRDVITRLHQAISQGSPIWQAMEKSETFTPLCLQLVRTGETSGALEQMLQNLADYHSEKTHQLSENLTSLLEPMLLLVTGAIIGTLVVAMYLPIFHLGDAISGAG
ncbi:protein transport protein HofC [Pseudocitrobacter cyperus]|uniref:Protein transport protein HofC n=1 Tax=Pseudocitrobacter cyperus TaxID=3112843 RepID=A0ABV0HI19_9ENTR